jgi:hypothetical protein
MVAPGVWIDERLDELFMESSPKVISLTAADRSGGQPAEHVSVKFDGE